MRGWHAVNVDTYKRDHGGKMWPNGVAFSGGTRWGHVSVHVSARQPANIELDQYSTRAFQKLNTGASLLRRTQGNGLRTGEVPSTHPDLVNRVQRYMIFQWCHDAWGCPAEQYLLD
jgi:hypothetical protein